ncbi:alkaline phosphatase D family protein [Streptomyces bobili]|uniref:alkaline phosphatase D family protein n=1 Tax=Streptomyces bobili TaxID=67280 RepID=UPI0033FC4E3F
MTENWIDRRQVLAVGTGVAAAAVIPAMASAAVAADTTPLRAAVFEYLDPWTKAKGLKTLLAQAGFTVVDLDLTRAANNQPQPVDLIAFGTFANNDGNRYNNYVRTHSASLQAFVADARVVLDLAQSDQHGATVTYLPGSLGAVRTDADYTTVHPVATGHPLVADLRVSDGQLFTGRKSEIYTSWETVTAWRSMRVLMACASSGFPPALLEGQHGNGRFLVSSLTVDKCYNEAGAAIQPADALADSVAFFTALANYTRMVRADTAPAVTPTAPPAPEVPTGPLVGHVDTSTARIWARPGLNAAAYAEWWCTVQNGADTQVTATAKLSDVNDHTLLVDVQGLLPATKYAFSLEPTNAAFGFAPLTGSFTTAPADGQPAKVTMGMGSCCDTVSNSIWDEIRRQGCDSFVMLGDTPYLDVTTLPEARAKHRQFLQLPQIAQVVSSMPVWGTWDDHDFGGNGVDGTYAGVVNNRTAFVDYRANATFGHDANGNLLATRGAGEGVYTSLRRGPIEIFLLDPRWFSNKNPSWADPLKKTCIGTRQWEWLQQRLKASTAQFKGLATGMIWTDKGNNEADDWHTYAHERDAIYKLIKDNSISGCFLISGDIHVSRALNYGTPVGYDLWEFTVSPMHSRTIAALDTKPTSQTWSALKPHVFLKLVADTTVADPTLTATWINRAGENLYEVTRKASQMRF